MDPVSIHKINQDINLQYKKQQQLVTNLVLYTLTALTCIIFCSSPAFWYPPLGATVNVFLYISLPKIISHFFSSKVVFIVGNLIVIFLVGEFKLFSPDYNDHDYDVPTAKTLHGSNKKGAGRLRKSSSKVNNYKDGGHQQINLRKQVAVDCDQKVMVGNYLEPRRQEDILLEGNWREEKTEDSKKKPDGDDQELSLPVKDLNKMADDFIARVNKQRRFEAEFCSFN